MKIAHIALADHFTEGMSYQDNMLVRCNCDAGHEVLVVSDAKAFNKYVLVCCLDGGEHYRCAMVFYHVQGGGFDWCRYTLMMLPSSCMCVYCVACLNSKRLPQTIWGRWFIGLGALSGVAYLSHYIVLRLVWIWFGWREPWPAPLSTFMDKCEIATITLTATFVFCWGYKWVASHSSTLCRR